MIKLPIYNSGPTDLQPRYTCVNVEDVYDVIHIHYSTPSFDAGDFLRASIDYTRGTASVVTDQDIENLKDLIASANQNPSSTPEFELIGARSATASTIDEYQVVDIQIKSEDPASA